eukprot:6457045-Amphidinium_carterae.1
MCIRDRLKEFVRRQTLLNRLPPRYCSTCIPVVRDCWHTLVENAPLHELHMRLSKFVLSLLQDGVAFALPH